MFVKVMTKAERDEHKRKVKWNEYTKIIGNDGKITLYAKHNVNSFLDWLMQLDRPLVSHKFFMVIH